MLRRRGRQDGQDSERRWGGLGYERRVKRDEKEVDGVEHAEGDEVDELKV